MSKFVAVEDEAQSHGSKVSWSFATVEREIFVDTLASRGYRNAPPPISEAVALKRAMEAVLKRSGIMVRPAAERGVYTLQLETKHKNRQNEYTQHLISSIDEDGRPQWRPQNGMPWSHALAVQLDDAYAKAKRELNSGDLNRWMNVQILAHLHPLRLENGDIFVPRTELVIIRQMQAIVAGLGAGRIYCLPLMKCADVLDLALAALRKEAEDAATEMDAYLAANTEIHARARHARIETLDAMRDKIRSYERLFDTPMRAMVASIEALKNRVNRTFFKAEAADRGQDVSEGSRVIELDERPALAAEDDGPSKRFQLLETDDINRKAAESDEDSESRKLDLE